MRTILAVLAISLLVGGLVTVMSDPAYAWACDFLTGGGFIITRGYAPSPAGFIPLHDPAHANFGVGGGCKFGSPTWGHLEYIDHGNGLNVHWITITGYYELWTDTDPKTHQPIGTRDICGTARTNLYGDVNWVVRATDNGEPGDTDIFYLRLTQPAGGGPQVIVYTTEGPEDHTLGGTGSGGGNIQLHKPNNSTSGSFGGSCPARDNV